MRGAPGALERKEAHIRWLNRIALTAEEGALQFLLYSTLDDTVPQPPALIEREQMSLCSCTLCIYVRVTGMLSRVYTVCSVTV